MTSKKERPSALERLWAPWRQSYISLAQSPENETACFMCEGIADDRDRERLLVHRGVHSVVMLNRFPYNNGHLLVAPRRHHGALEGLERDEVLDIQQTLARMVTALTTLLRPDGFNVGLNLGRAAGAGLPGHLHWHVVPRWNGDTNFMPVLSNAKVISQSLESLYDLLAAHLRNP
jgi:ATP adenylyltransferase